MMVVWVTLLLLQRGYSLVPVTTVQLEEAVTFTCANKDLNSKEIHWYKQSAGDTLKLVVTLWQSTPKYGPEFSESRMKVNLDNSLSNLTILKTITEDEGMYHCGVTEWINTAWSGTYLLVKGNTQRTSTYTVAQWSTASDPVRPGDSVSLQCSVLSDSESKTCPGDHSVYWFRAGSDKSHPDIIYTDGNHQCEERSDTVKSCVHGFSKTVSSSDAGTYYCAVATCGQILFGNGTKLHFEGTSTASVIIFLLCVVLALSLIVIFFLICAIKNNKCDYCNAAVVLNKNCGVQKIQQKEEDTWIYSAVVFTVKTDRGGIKDAKAAEGAKIYAALKAFGLD